MPSSRASSPLSSAVPSPPASHAPRRSASVRSLSSVSIGSERAQRSPTSSTAPLSHASAGGSDDESDLTEEEEEEVEHRSSPLMPIMPNGDLEELSDEEGDEVLTIVSKPRSRDIRNRINSQALSSSPSLSPSPSLTPPPPSALLKSKTLSPSPPDVPVIHEAGPAESDISDDEGDVNGRSEQIIIDDHNHKSDLEEADDAEQDEEDMEEEGDETMRAVEADEEDAELLDQEDLDQHQGDLHNGDDIPAEGIPEVVVETDEPEQDYQEEGLEADEADEAEDEDDEPENDDSTIVMPARAFHSSHAPPPSSAQLRSLLTLELKFAALRDKLYIERMEEAAAEEQMVLEGTHPALQFLHKTLSDRRERLHEVASRRHFEALGELKRAREADKSHTWSWWTEQRDQLHWEEFDRTWSKRRRLAREKNEIETTRFIKPVPRAGDRPRGVDWSTGVAPAKMSAVQAANDLAMMESRPMQMQQNHMLSRHASPAVYAPPMAQQPLPQSQASLPPAAATIPSARPPQVQMAQAPPTFPYSSMPYHNNPPRTIQTVQANAQPPGPSRMQQSHPQLYSQSQNQQPPLLQQQTQQQPQPQSQQQPQQQQQPRPQGRLVPTTSDLFETGRKDASVSPMPWNKPDIKGTNGHSKDPHSSLVKPEERPPSRFPGLNEYMTSAKPATAAIPPTGSGYSSILTAGAKTLSPPKPPPHSLLGSFGPRPPGPFGSAQNGNATAVGATATRP